MTRSLLIAAVAAIAFALNACADSDGAAVPDASNPSVPDSGLVARDASANPADAAVGDAGTEGPGDAGLARYGQLTSIGFSTPYLLDGTNHSEAYLQAHSEDVQRETPAFTGVYTSAASPIPPATALGTLSWADHYPASGSMSALVTVEQHSTDETSSAVFPIVYLQFNSDAIATGANAVGMGSGDDATLILLEKLAGAYCCSAIGVGTLNVTTATGTTAPEGGALALDGRDMALYHPSETPYGDITSKVLRAGYGVCPKR